MKLRCRSVALALFVLLLAGCSAKTPTPSPSEIPTPTGPLTTPVQQTPQEEVLSYVDWALAADEVTLRCWLSNGSGPCPLSMEAYKEDVRAIFAGYEWNKLEEKLPVPEWTPGTWSIQLLPEDMKVCLTVSNNLDQLTVSFSGNEKESMFYTAEGAAELCLQLADLHPGPEARLLLTTVPADMDIDDQELIETYAANFEESYLASGHISDLGLTRLEMSDPQKHGESLYPFFHLAFSVTPIDPNDPYWTGRTADSDGRYSYDLLLHLLPGEDNIWRCDWFQTPPRST